MAVFPDTDEAGLARAAEKIRLTVEAYPWNLPNGRTVTVSVGTAIKTPDADWDRAVDSADKALYEAKASGRNRVVFGRLDLGSPVREDGAPEPQRKQQGDPSCKGQPDDR